MIYQKILTESLPYRVFTSSLGKFPRHRHADFEFNYCASGSFHIVIEGKTHLVTEGCTTFIPPMCAHMIPCESDCRVTTVIVGVSLLSRHFGDFLRFDLKPDVCDLNAPGGKELQKLFCECAEAVNKEGAAAELTLIGNIYKILAYFLRTLSDAGNYATDTHAFTHLESMEKALELIHFNYKEPLTVEEVANRLGYSKSNFCKIFKKTVGEGFHQALNRHRVACAAKLLTVSSMPIAEIAAEVGFSEAKSFCRVFKAILGKTPGTYRKTKGKDEELPLF